MALLYAFVDRKGKDVTSTNVAKPPIMANDGLVPPNDGISRADKEQLNLLNDTPHSKKPVRSLQANTTAQNTSAGFGFLDLPAELRLQIYGYLVPNKNISWKELHLQGAGLRGACRQTNTEATKFIFRTISWTFNYDQVTQLSTYMGLVESHDHSFPRRLNTQRLPSIWSHYTRHFYLNACFYEHGLIDRLMIRAHLNQHHGRMLQQGPKFLEMMFPVVSAITVLYFTYEMLEPLTFWRELFALENRCLKEVRFVFDADAGRKHWQMATLVEIAKPMWEHVIEDKEKHPHDFRVIDVSNTQLIQVVLLWRRSKPDPFRKGIAWGELPIPKES